MSLFFAETSHAQDPTCDFDHPNKPGIITKQPTPVYSAPSSPNSSLTLSINDSIWIKRKDANRYAISVQSTKDEIDGWINAHHVKCELEPLPMGKVIEYVQDHKDDILKVSPKDTVFSILNAGTKENRIETKYFAKTHQRIIGKTEKGGKIQDKVSDKNQAFILASNQPNTLCSIENNNCIKVFRAQSYFVFDVEYNNKGLFFLIGKYGKLKHKSKVRKNKNALLGWVRASDGFLWDTFYGLRVNTKKNEYICAYKKPEKVPLGQPKIYIDNSEKAPENCLRIYGGPYWKNNPNHFRIPVINDPDVNEKHPLMSILPFNVEVKPIRDIENLSSYTGVDVVFVIDATTSMKNHIINIAEKFIPQIKRELKKTNSDNLTYRYGWITYTDTTLPAPSPSKKLSEKCTESNEHELIELSDTKTSENDKDDYPEDGASAIIKGLGILKETCNSDHMKVLVVIGDAGIKLTEKSKTSIAKMMRPLNDRAEKTVMPIFVKTPYDQEIYKKAKKKGKANLKRYTDSHAAFLEDADSILNSFNLLLSTNLNQNALNALKEINSLKNKASHVYNLEKEQQTDVSTTIAKAIGQRANQKIYNNVRRRLDAGYPVIQAVLETAKTFGNAPAVIFSSLLSEGCGEKERVKNSADETFDPCYQFQPNAWNVVEQSSLAYVRYGAPLEVDVAMRQHHLSDLVDALEEFTETIQTKQGVEQRGVADLALLELIQAHLGDFPKWKKKKGAAYEYLMRQKSFPIAIGSPLLNYEVGKLTDVNEILDGEFLYLKDWVIDATEILNIVKGGHIPIERAANSPDGFYIEKVPTYLALELKAPVENLKLSETLEKRLYRLKSVKGLIESANPSSTFPSICKTPKGDRAIMCWIPNRWLP